MKKENKLVKLTSFVLLITVIAILLVAGTYAKYTSTAIGSDKATVAKWDIKAGVKDNELSITGSDATVAFNLFETILDEDGTNEEDVAADKIAPGTSGKFELSVKNDSQVDAEYSINFTVKKANVAEGEDDTSNVPLQFRVNGGDWKSSLDAVTAKELKMATSSIATVEWKWEYETASETDGTVTAGDLKDTGLGITPEEVEVKATLVVDQVD